MGCKEREGALPTVTAQGMTILCLFVVQVIVGTAHEDNKYRVNKQTNNILILKPSGDRNYQLLLAAHRRCFLEENKLSFSLWFLLTNISAEQFVVTQAGLPNQGLLKSIMKN